MQINWPFNESINFGISVIMYQVEASKFGSNVELDMLRNKPTLQLI